tara:strand:- start:92 stop:274 length:183 start_codon:yes stop_codon:yes gene_type:complete
MKTLLTIFVLFFSCEVIAEGLKNSSSRCAHGSNGDVSCGGQSSRCAHGSNGSVCCGGYDN